MSRRGPVLGIVPVRAHSQGLKNKALQLIDGEPLLLRTLMKVAPLVNRLVISTNDATVAGIARLWGFAVEDRPAFLAGPDIPLAPVIQHIASNPEYARYETVACFQVTVPFIEAETLSAMIDGFRHTEDDWWVAVAPCEGIHWQKGAPEEVPVLLQQRVNRQQADARLDPHRETGIQVMTGDYARTNTGRLGGYRIEAAEALDIDTVEDLMVAKLRARRRHVHFFVKVGDAVGSGHLHRALTLADAMPHHWATVGLDVNSPGWARDLRKDRGYDTWDGYGPAPDLVVNDTLDTSREWITSWQAKGVKVATFEDEGTGRLHADLVVNELLPGPTLLGDRLHGPEYSVLRPEFACHPPHRAPGDATKVLVSFGGTDPAGLNPRVAKVLLKHWPDQLAVRLALGPGVESTGLVDAFRHIEEDREGLMAEHMAWADLCVTAQGRTQYEAAAMGVPTVTIAANERESRHVACPGHVHLGLHAQVTDIQLGEVLDNILVNPALRAEMAETARRAVDGRGTERVVAALDRLLAD